MNDSTTRILVVDDFAPWRRMVELALRPKLDIEIVGEAGDGTTAIAKVIELKPDMVILDIGLPDLGGIEVAREILQVAPKTRILFLTENTSRDIVREAMRTGARGFVAKHSAARDLMTAVEELLRDNHFVSLGVEGPQLGDRLPHRKKNIQ